MALVLAVGIGFATPPPSNAGESGKDEEVKACVQCCSQRMVDCLKQSGVGLCFGKFYQQCAENCRSDGTTPSEWTCWQPEEPASGE